MSQEPKDPFLGYKNIAFLRTGLPVDNEEISPEIFLDYAKWQVCKARNILWHDPIWDRYTVPEILIEWFSIRFDQDPEIRAQFQAQLVKVPDKTYDWFEKMEKTYSTQKSDKIEKEAVVEQPEEFQDKY